MRVLLSLAAVAIAALCSTGAFAQSETDRLRDALRSAIAQARSLEDQRAALQSRLTEAERNRDAAVKDAADARAQTEKVEKENRETVEELNKRLTESEQTLDTTVEKWRTAYEEAANLARNIEAQRAKFETEAGTYKASTKSCISRNVLLVKAGQDLVQRYKAVTLDTGLAAYEKVFQFSRVEAQNQVQDLTDKFLDQKVKP
jgi:chromosome segregation ATPase